MWPGLDDNIFSKHSYTCNGNSKRTYKIGKNKYSTYKETTTASYNQDNTGREITQIFHIRFFHPPIHQMSRQIE